tara:strand:+ start:156 stop:2117 length:1962 start_codon:yes stop_codon:yes gene_type:complete
MPFFIFSQSYQDTISEKKYPFKVFDSSYEGYLEKGQKVNGLKNGEILLLDIGTGNVKAKVNYINGKISGAFTTYHKNSKPELQGNIKDGDYHGLWKSYHSNGNLESEGHYKNRSKKIGNWKYYHANGNLESEGNCEDGNCIGYWKYYNYLGLLKAEGNLDGNYDGGYYRVDLWKTYHFKGKLESEGSYKDGKQIGLWKTYHYNDTLSSIGKYDGGSKHGLWKCYHDNGKLKSNGKYDYSYKDGDWVYYHNNGNKSALGSYKGGTGGYKKEGKWSYYDKNNILIARANYIKGVLSTKNIKVNPPKKKNKPHYQIINDTLFKVKYHKNGQINEKLGLKDFDLDNPSINQDVYLIYEKFDKKGKLESSINSIIEVYEEEEVKTSCISHYHKNGMLAFRSGYEEESYYGNTKLYYSNGNLAAKFYNVEGGLVIAYIEGDICFYYENGKLAFKGSVEEYHYGDKHIVYGNDLNWYYNNGKLAAKTVGGEDGVDLANGPFSIYYENGNLAIQGEFYEASWRGGEWKWYYENGNLSLKEVYTQDYKNEIDNGVTYFENGQVELIFSYHYDNPGLEFGNWKCYDETGSLKWQKTFESDENEEIICSGDCDKKVKVPYYKMKDFYQPEIIFPFKKFDKLVSKKSKELFKASILNLEDFYFDY